MVETAAQPQSRRVALIGPVPPFRSGIAPHTASLAEALDEQAEVLLLSFTRQYPAWLYPGESDRDPDASPPEKPRPAFILDPLDPRTWMKAVRRIEAFGADLVILPWWTVFFAPMSWALARACRRRGIPLRLFCHNVLDHETAGWKALATKAVFRQAGAFAAHTRAEAARLARLCPGASTILHPHPLYDRFPPPSTALPRRADLELLFFGLVRPYKGLPVLLEAMSQLDEQTSVQLSVVGEFWSGREEAVAQIESLGLASRVELVPRYVSDAEAASYFERADAVVLPYLSVTGSGVVANAFYYGKPVIASDLGGLAEAVVEGETGLLVPPDDAAALAKAIAGLSAERAADMEPSIRERTRDLTWAHLANCLLTVPSTPRDGEAETPERAQPSLAASQPTT